MMSPSIQPLSVSPYIVPGISSFVNSGLSVFLANKTRGGMAYPEALQHANTVICFLLAEVTARGCLAPFTATTEDGLWSKGTPVSSQLKICAGLSLRSFSLSVCSSKSKYLSIKTGSVAADLA